MDSTSTAGAREPIRRASRHPHSPFVIPSSFGLTHSSFARLFVTLTLALLSTFAAATEPTRKELWVPSEHLNQVLKDHPNAVLLSPEQYDTLIRDAGKLKPVEDPKNKPPIDLVVESLHLKGKLTPEAETIRLSGTLTVFSTSEDWTQIELPWHLPLLAVHAEGTMLVSLSKVESIEPLDTRAFTLPRTLHLHVKGRGRHMLTFDTHLHLQRDVARGWGELYICGPALAGYIDLDLPVDLQLLNSSAFQKLDASTVRLPFVKNTTFNIATINHTDGKRGRLDIPVAAVARWTTAGLTLPDDAPRFADGTTLDASLSETEVITEQQLSLTKGGTSAATRTLQLRLTPQAQVTAVKGSEVIQWHQENDQLHLTLAANASTTVFTTTLRQPIEPEAKQIFLPQIFLPSPTTATVNLRTSEGLELLAASGTEMRDSSTAGTKTFTAPLASLPTLQVRVAKPRLEVDADTLVQLDKDSLTLTRTLNLRTDRPVHELRVTLPEGEEFIRIDSAAKDFEWKRVARVIEMRFPAGVTLAAPVLVNLHTRQKLLKAWSGPRIPELVKVQPLSIPEAVKIAGYSALSFDDSWRVALKDTSGLEDRDAKLAPVKGRIAWFGLRDWALGFEVERAEPVFSAEITAYALPRARTVEIEGEITLDISGAPLRTFQLKLPAAEAKLLRMTSPLIGQQQLDEATGQWTFTLRQESTGRQPLRFRLSLPAKVATNAEQTLQASLPVLELPAARRFAGTWVIEANTDTQVSFESQSLQPLDVLRAPPITGYQPRHRLIAAYTYGTGAHTLSLTAKRHAHSELAVMVVNKLILTSVLGPDGGHRHEAVFLLHHTGEQFMPVKLPDNAQLLSLEVEHLGVKPVRGENGMIAVPLPGNSANQKSIRVTLVYEETGAPWSSAGEQQIQPPKLTGELPVLETDWKVHAPDGRHYQLEGGFMKAITSAEVPTLWRTLGLRSREVDYLPGGTTDSKLETARREVQRTFETADQISADAQKTHETTSRLRQVIIPQIQFSGASLSEAVEFLRYRWNAPEQHEDVTLPKLSFILADGVLQSPASISLDLKDVPFLEALRYITELAGVRYRVRENAVLIESLVHGPDLLMSKAFKVTTGLIEKLTRATHSPEPFAEPQNHPFTPPSYIPGSTEWWLEILKSQGILFPDNSDITPDPDRGEIIVRNTQPNLDLVESFLAYETDPAISALLYPAGQVEEKQVEGNAQAYMINKLNSIIIPQVQFSNATIEEALEFLRVKNRDLDVMESDPAKKGVSFILKSGEVAPSANISLDLKDVPLGEALRYVTELAGMKYKVEPYAVLVVPITETTTEQYTRIYKVPPNILRGDLGMPTETAAAAPADPFAAGGTNNIRGAGLMPWISALDMLKAQGILFPEGTTAVFNAETNQLIVKNTQANLDLVDGFVGHALEAAKTQETDSSTKSGLLPLDLDLPTLGQVLRFSGHQAPEALTLRYVSWERQLGFAMLAAVTGIAAFGRWGRRRPWRSSLLFVAVLTFGAPLMMTGPALALANALLFGWLLALGGWIVWRVVEKTSSALKLAKGEEVAL
jgi:hypothetical protein